MDQRQHWAVDVLYTLDPPGDNETPFTMGYDFCCRSPLGFEVVNSVWLYKGHREHNLAGVKRLLEHWTEGGWVYELIGEKSE
jgi:hypothetical protein